MLSACVSLEQVHSLLRIILSVRKKHRRENFKSSIDERFIVTNPCRTMNFLFFCIFKVRIFFCFTLLLARFGELT